MPVAAPAIVVDTSKAPCYNSSNFLKSTAMTGKKGTVNQTSEPGTVKARMRKVPGPPLSCGLKPCKGEYAFAV